MFKRILVGYDLSPQSRRALGIASGLARSFGSELIVVHVVPLPQVIKRWARPTDKIDLKNYEGVLDNQISAAQDELERAVARLVPTTLLDVRCIARAGTAPNVLVDVADRDSADLIVVGRGKRGVLGPTADRVVRLAGRAVLVAPVSGPDAAGVLLDGKDRRRRSPIKLRVNRSGRRTR